MRIKLLILVLLCIQFGTFIGQSYGVFPTIITALCILLLALVIENQISENEN